MKFVLVIFFICFAEAAKIISKRDIIDDSIDNNAAIEVTLTSADFEDLHNVHEIDLKSIGINVLEDPTAGNYSEGDININNLKTFAENANGYARNAIKSRYRKWPNNEIPYTLSSKYGSYAKSMIAKAMDEYHRKTCIKFIARDIRKHNDYVYIHPDDGCYSLVGKVGGKQPLSLDSGCIQVGTIVHELMHTVGFFHEQSRNDRDKYIKIVWENVMNGADDQFEKYGINVIDHLNEPYDYASIMHYGPYAFSANGKKTITPSQNGADKMGQRVQFSEIDLRKINKLYDCKGSFSGNSVLETTNNNNNNQICENLNWRCNFWSMAIFNYCEKFSEIRNVICRYSCGNCPTEDREFGLGKVKECFDTGLFCKGIAPEVHCRLPRLAAACLASCGLC